ncbi:hypothetical protein [Gilliamella sp. wkB112]|uniref:hypothetical protein n=1 Tax=Gilliamella sp. wkB112 TaxID=3120257 RepID=UPI00080EAB52|nr:hypothetical protein [Gilliamella apicola]OCG02322.1 hypothetical protein A9G12_11510 [Gilliamella apicola]
MNSEFFYRPLWQQYSCCFLFFLFLFGVGYLLVIEDIKQQADQQIQQYDENLTKIDQLQAKINRYKSSKNHLLSTISEKELAQALAQHHLILRTFKYIEIDDTVNWDIELNGEFADFMALMTSFNDDYYYLDFQHLMISKHESELQIAFTLLFKKGG